MNLTGFSSKPKQRSNFAYRVTADIAIAVSIFVAPWWFTCAVALLAAFFFDHYVELIIACFVLDSLSNAPIPRFFHFEFVLTVASLAVYWVVQHLKQRLIFYRER